MNCEDTMSSGRGQGQGQVGTIIDDTQETGGLPVSYNQNQHTTWQPYLNYNSGYQPPLYQPPPYQQLPYPQSPYQPLPYQQSPYQSLPSYQWQPPSMHYHQDFLPMQYQPQIPFHQYQQLSHQQWQSFPQHPPQAAGIPPQIYDNGSVGATSADTPEAYSNGPYGITSAVTGNTVKNEASEAEDNGDHRTGRLIRLLDKRLRFRVIDRNITLASLPPRKPAWPAIITQPTEKLAVGVTTDGIGSRRTRMGRLRTKAGKLVYLTISTKFETMTPEEEPITQPPGLHFHDEDGVIVSKLNVLFLQEFRMQKDRETAAVAYAERYRLARNEAIAAHILKGLQWRKERKLWEHGCIMQVWETRGSQVTFPHGATTQLIHDTAPTAGQYDTDQGIEDSDDADDGPSTDTQSDCTETSVSLPMLKAIVAKKGNPAKVAKSKPRRLLPLLSLSCPSVEVQDKVYSKATEEDHYLNASHRCSIDPSFAGIAS